ncbi:MAG TPA: hypothetical protein PLM53_04930 [Spirochaetota bacterium]|nr:hypothetical protein [Spirochaetota bacterium]HPC40391.1 hypothetical protein [Spirochaetota bacterium]HPL17327.1 hypothetical protein [Spirochaetota bacterium]HQF07690.1 hypothetical protein [Spirochaetota bacterium]HQH96422.1 hypothetical protein [Spirochaetota bacterium]
MEKEPNNSFSTASDIRPDERFLGFMGTPHDRDFYRIRVDGRAILDIQLSGVKGINLAMKIWKGGEEPKLIKWIDDNRKSSPERMANLTVTAGDYYIEVFQSDRDQKKSDRENAYELMLKKREAISEESEPNDSRDDADTLHLNKEITGYFSPAYNRLNEQKENLHREEDWFAIDVNLKDGTPELMDVSLSGVSDVNSVLYLYDSEGMEIAMSDNGGAGEPESINGAGIKKSGTYYIMVASKGYTANHEEPYTLNAALKEHDSGTEMEPNNDFESANVFSNIIAGRINSKDDKDVYLCQANGGPSIYRIELRPPEDMDAIMTLYNSDREKIIDINSGARSKKEVYPNFYTDKDFYIAVSARTGDKVPAGEYMLAVTPFKSIADQEREPNNEQSQANKLTGKMITGFTSTRGDKDYFIISGDSRIKQKFEIQGVRGGAIKVSVTDPLGYIIKTIDVPGDRKAVFSEMIDKKGYLIIEAETENYDNPYTVNLRGAQ